MATNEFEKRIQTLKNFFTEKQYYWNEGIDVNINSGSMGLTEDSVSTTLNFYYGWQCHGFAQFFLALACGYNIGIRTNDKSILAGPLIVYDDLQNTDKFDEFKIGDLIRTDGWDNVHCEHSAIVVGIEKYKSEETDEIDSIITVIQSIGDECPINVGVFNDTPDGEGNLDLNPSMKASFLRENCTFVARCPQDRLDNLNFVEVFLKDTGSINRCSIFEVSGTRYFNLPDVYSVMNDTPEKDHEYTGWWTRNNDEGKVLTNGDPISDDDFLYTSSRSLYIRSTRIKFDVTFDYNDGTGACLTEKKEAGTSIGSLPVPPLREYFEFMGWATENDGKNIIGEDFPVQIYDFWLYASWKHKSKITLKDNYDGGSEQIIEMLSDEYVYSLPDPSPRKYFTFKGWVTESNGTNVLDPNKHIPEYDKFTLYAYWERNRHSVFLDDNYTGGKTQTVVKSAGLPIETLPETSRDYYDFKGWMTESKGTSVIGSDFKVPDYWFRLYASWERRKCTVQYFYNVDDRLLKSEIVDCGSDYVVRSPFSHEEGYDFKGWIDLIHNKAYYPGETIFITTDINLVTKWEEKKAVIHFDTGGLFELPPLSITYNEAKKDFGEEIIPCSILPYGTSDYTVSGWKIKGGNGKVYTNIMILPEFRSYTLIAVDPAPIMGAVNYVLDSVPETGNENVLRYQPKVCAEPVILQRQCPVKGMGYNFKGWYDDEGNHYPPQAMITAREGVTLYPDWIGGCYVIRYDTGVNDDDPYPAYDPPYAQNYPIIRDENGDPAVDRGIVISSDIPVRRGYRFTGWKYRDLNGDDKTISPGDLLILTDAYQSIDYSQSNTVILTATWERELRTVSFYLDHSSNDEIYVATVGLYGRYCEQYCGEDEFVPYDLPAVEDRSKSICFVGWYVNGIKITPDSIVTDEYSYNAFALFTPDPGFNDLSDCEWAIPSIAKCKHYGYLFGTSENEFSPDDPVTRGTAVTVLYRMAGKPLTGTNSFYDVPSSMSCCPAVTWGKVNGIVFGVSENLFNPEQVISRRQMVQFLYRYAKDKGYSVENGSYTVVDTGELNDPNYGNDAYRSLYWAISNGLITMMDGEEKYKPDDVLPRAQLAVLLIKFRNLYA